MLTAEQLEVRRKGVFSSDIPIIAGLIPKTWDRSTWLDLYNEKLALVPPWDGSAGTDRGNLMEPIIAAKWGEENGRKVRHSDETIFHPSIPWIGAHVDYFTDDEREDPVECKYVGKFSGDKWKVKNDIGKYVKQPNGHPVRRPPDYVIAQVQWQLGCKQKELSYVAAFLEGPEGPALPKPRLIESFEIRFDKRLFEQLVFLAKRFMEHVENRIPPNE